MPLIFFIHFYLIEGGALSIRGSDIRVDILLNNFFLCRIFANNFNISINFILYVFF